MCVCVCVCVSTCNSRNVSEWPENKQSDCLCSQTSAPRYISFKIHYRESCLRTHTHARTRAHTHTHTPLADRRERWREGGKDRREFVTTGP